MGADCRVGRQVLIISAANGKTVNAKDYSSFPADSRLDKRGPFETDIFVP